MLHNYSENPETPVNRSISMYSIDLFSHKVSL